MNCFKHTPTPKLHTPNPQTRKPHTAPVIGLYSAAIGPFLYAFLGTAKHMSVGPISLASIFIPVALKQAGFDVIDSSPEAKAARTAGAGVLTFYLFGVFLVMSLLRLGALIR